MMEAPLTTEETIDCLRFGPMEFGGFVRHTSPSREQRSRMFVQECLNMVIGNLRNRADTTDATLEHHREGGEEEARTVDPLVDPETHSSRGRISSPLEHVRSDLNMALRAERWTETNQLQGAVTRLLDATSGADPEGLSMRVVNNIFQRLYSIHKNRELDERKNKVVTLSCLYLEDMNSLMQ